MLRGGERCREAVRILDSRKVNFEYDGEMQADVALNHSLMRRLYPFCRLSGPANILVMPALHSANIAAKMLQEIGGGTVIGPVLLGLSKPVQVVQMGATVNDIVNSAVLAAHDAIRAGG
ncbi:MAG: phosphate acyltransferase, partial [Alphaproteobacteria bacterium]